MRSPVFKGEGRILLCISGRADDGGWCEAAHRAAANVKALGGRIEIDDRIPEALEATCTAVVGHGMAFAGPIVRAAWANPNISFLLTDDLQQDGELPPNLCRIDWRWDEGAFLAGVLAGSLTKSGNVGILGGDACQTQYLAMMGFVRGVRSESPGAEILTALAGTFDDPGRGFRLANALFDEGVDVLLHTADSTGRGAIQAAEECGRTVIGFLNDDDRTHDCVAGVITTDVEGAMTTLLVGLAQGLATSGLVECGLASGRQRFEITGSVPEPARRRVEELAAKIAENSLRVRTPGAVRSTPSI